MFTASGGLVHFCEMEEQKFLIWMAIDTLHGCLYQCLIKTARTLGSSSLNWESVSPSMMCQKKSAEIGGLHILPIRMRPFYQHGVGDTKYPLADTPRRMAEPNLLSQLPNEWYTRIQNMNPWTQTVACTLFQHNNTPLQEIGHSHNASHKYWMSGVLSCMDCARKISISYILQIKHAITKCVSSIKFIVLKQNVRLWQHAWHMDKSTKYYDFVHHVFRKDHFELELSLKWPITCQRAGVIVVIHNHIIWCFCPYVMYVVITLHFVSTQWI